ncbi:hypothetical protein NEOC65_002107 [Neochlamydia sp. AcF65]|nr:hypothetical protein [Neochlamydia sp. AcF65]
MRPLIEAQQLKIRFHLRQGKRSLSRFLYIFVVCLKVKVSECLKTVSKAHK